ESKSSYPMAEDLGVIPDFVRESLTRLQVPGYKIMRWEKYWKSPQQNYIHPCDYPEFSIATTGSHDTDTLAEWWETIGEKERRELVEMTGVDGQHGSLDFDHRIHMGLLEMLYHADSLFVILPIQDLFGWRDRINVPGTCGKTNWSYRLSGPVGMLNKDSGCRSCIDEIRQYIKEADREI
ncbi:MAG TPA: 4-alpha-glucanotransferase, partial [bacterium]|nr:4-alpha-glucanotransferase [bacterium]